MFLALLTIKLNVMEVKLNVWEVKLNVMVSEIECDGCGIGADLDADVPNFV
jgi:hypothetical protein